MLMLCYAGAPCGVHDQRNSRQKRLPGSAPTAEALPEALRAAREPTTSCRSDSRPGSAWYDEVLCSSVTAGAVRRCAKPIATLRVHTPSKLSSLAYNSHVCTVVWTFNWQV